MEGQFSYQDFDLLIRRGPPGSDRARVLRSPTEECAPVLFPLPFSELADNPELAELPWEFLYDPRRDRFLAQSRRVGHTGQLASCQR